MATLSTTPPLNPPTLKPDILPNIDMTTLTQSELYTLSLLSPSSFDLRRTHDLVIPTIDRSLFNESAGSRRQTYSRPSPTHSHHHHHRHRIAGLLPSSSSSHHHLHHHYHPPSTTTTTTDNNPDRLENHSIINFLKKILPQNPQFSDIEFTPTPLPQLQPQQQSLFFSPPAGNLGTIPEQIVRKRKRGRKPKVKPGFEEERENGLEIVNKNGVAVNVLDLANLDDPYGEEIRRRTEGLGNEEELLAFLTDLGGQWCSRRRKRKIVDACVIGDVMPVGWKLLLGLKRREGRASVYVRRYIRFVWSL